MCKLEDHRGGTFRGYIAMLATVQEFRGRGIATKLVEMAIESMKSRGADEVCLYCWIILFIDLSDKTDCSRDRSDEHSIATTI